LLLVWLLLAITLLAEAVVWRIFRSQKQHRSRRLLRRFGLLAAMTLTPVAVLFAFAAIAPLQTPYSRLEAPGWVVLDTNGVVLQRETSDGLRIPVSLDEIAPVMIEATIAAEDQRFRSHPGIDPLAIGRALIRLPFQRSGASTLSQQLARRLYIDDSTPLLERKSREALIALQLEARYSKDEILSLYLNDVYYGRGAYGVEAAARVYFGVSAANLDLAQAALLAGLPQRPAEYGESLETPGVAERQRYVLTRMVKTGRATPVEATLAMQESLVLLPEQAPVAAPHFVAYVLDELARLQPNLVAKPGLVIETTLDAGLQNEAQQQVDYQLASLKNKAVGNAAVVVLEPATGRLLAMVGSSDFYDDAKSGQVNMALAPRQPGSALKPFLYATAFEQGFTAASMLLDVPSGFDTEAGLYQPLNYDRRFNGPLSLRTALASSLNVPAVRTLDTVGVDALLATAHRFGLSTLTDAEVYGLALTLGGGEVRLLDLANAYATLANGGLLHQPYAIERILDANGATVYQHRTLTQGRAISEQHAFILADILSDNNARELGFGYAPTLQLPFRTAVKTGTTTEFRDNWTLGFTAERAVGVWVGNADNTPMRNVSGIEGAGPIWRGVMEAAMAGVSPAWPGPPDGLVRAVVCLPTGLLPGPNCPLTADEWFVDGSQPRQTEDYYRRGEDGRLLINPPAEARAWAIAAGLPLYDGTASSTAAFVVQPANGSVLFMAPELASQAVMLRASPPAGTRSIEFVIDGTAVGSAAPEDAAFVWSLQPGFHLLEVRASLLDGSVVTASSRFEVKR
jgi:penicillin-binding protein 1C